MPSVPGIAFGQEVLESALWKTGRIGVGVETFGWLFKKVR